MVKTRRHVRSIFKQLRHVRLLIVSVFFISALPLIVIWDLPLLRPLNRLIGGLLTDLEGWQVFFTMLFLGLLCTAVVVCQALIIDSTPRRYNPEEPLFRESALFKRWSSRSGNDVLNPHVPKWLDNALGFPVGFWQLTIFAFLCAFWLSVIVVRSDLSTNSWSQLFFGLAGVGTASFLFLIAGVISHGLNQLRTSMVPTFVFTVASFLLTLLAYGIFGTATRQNVTAPVVYVLVLSTILVYIVGQLEIHLPIWGIPGWVFLVLILILGTQLRRWVPVAPYSLDVTEVAENYSAEAHTLHNPIRDGNLVVVAVSGGGILSAAWSTYWLEELLLLRPELECEIRLFSTVSGGSVGVAYYLTALQQAISVKDAPKPSCDGREAQKAAGTAFEAAKQSSLSAITYSLAYSDLRRFLHLGSNSSNDRGRNLEAVWLKRASTPQKGLSVVGTSMSDFAASITALKMPGFIFNATSLETGRRIMITPLSFAAMTHRERAQTLSELWAGNNSYIDLGIFTAARASATFPYVSPAVQSDLEAADTSSGPMGYHLIDGGYNDNFGIQSALDFLRPIVNNPSSNDIRRILIIELRLTNFENETLDPKRYDAFRAEWLGPPYGVLNVAQKAQIENNNIDLGAFAGAANRLGLPVEILTIQPDKTVPGPLSWQLSRKESSTLFSSASHITADPAFKPRCTSAGKLSSMDCAQKMVFESWKGINCFSEMDKFLDMDVQGLQDFEFAKECTSRRSLN